VSDPRHDAFLREYTRGVSERLGPPHRRTATAAAGPALAPPEPFALGGLLVRETGAVHGWVTIEGGSITHVSAARPKDVRLLDTGGVVLPGLLDMHNHPDFNVFAPWEPPEVYPNRYAWRDSKLYDELVKAPTRHMDDVLTIKGARLRYAEIRAMVGGVTAVQGMNGSGDSEEALVRNVDRFIFGDHRARTTIDLPAKVDGFGWDSFAAILRAIDEHRVDAHYIHLAEGQRDDPVSRSEFDKLKGFGGLRPQTIIIHGSALAPGQLQEAADVGAKLVWSPQSNLRLYRQTTDVAAALDAGLPVCLGADWMPSGSLSLLDEMRVAGHELRTQGVEVTSRMLVEMVTSRAADIAGLGAELGRLEPGRPADLVVLTRLADDAYDSVLLADPGDVDLVVIGGDVTYARADWLDALAPGAASPDLRPVIAWGRRMVLDNGYRARPDDGTPPDLDLLRADLIEAYPAIGPIWA
jgi:5-methylthioadenosine/S-adenosylhomocysteine deaminase